MFIDNEPVKKHDGADTCDRFAITSVMYYVSFIGAVWSVIESGILKNCDGSDHI